MRSKSRQLDELLPRFPQQSAHCHSMYNLYRPAALGKGGSITQGSHHRPIRSGQEREEEEEKKEEEEKEEEEKKEEEEGGQMAAEAPVRSSLEAPVAP